MMADPDYLYHQHGLLFATNGFSSRATHASGVRFGLHQLQWSGQNTSDGLGYVFP